VNSPRNLAISIALAAVYFIAAKFGLSLAVVAAQVSPVWPPSGIALAALLLLGRNVWPGVFLGAFLANITANEPFPVALAIASGNTLEAVAGSWLILKYVGEGNYLSRMRDVAGLIFFSAFLSTMISATIGATSLCLGGVQSWDSYSALWTTWWLGDAGGILSVAPVFLAWGIGPYARLTVRGVARALLLTSALLLVYVGIFIKPELLGLEQSYPFLIFPIVILVGAFFQQRGTTLMTVVMPGIAIWATQQHLGPFAGLPEEQALKELQIFTIIVSVTGLFLSAAITERRAAEAHLEESLTRTRQMVDAALDAVVSVNRTGLITEWNNAAESLFGWPRKEALGRPMAELIIPPALRAAHLSGFRRMTEGGPPKIIGQRVEMEALHRTGHTFPVELAVTMQTLKGEAYFTAFISDISARKKVEETQGLLASIVESSADAIISKTLDGVITSWNAGAEHLLGYTAREMVGQDIRLIIPPERQRDEQQIIASIAAGRRVTDFETVRIDKNGRHIDVSLTVSPIIDSGGRVIGASKIARDITSRKMTELQFLHYTEALKRSNQELDDFVYIVSHDLKEPLRGLYSYAQFLEEDYHEKLDAEGQEKLGTMMKLAKRMEELIDTLLYYSRLGRTELAVQETDLNAVLAQSMELMQPAMEKGGATVSIEKPLPCIVCDGVRIKEVFHNLVMNAIKYNDRKDKVIKVGCTTSHAEYPGRPVFYVADNGIGIAEKDREMIFKMFKRLHDRNAYGGGTGSGLAIVKKIIDRHDGRIWVESDGKNGSTFYFVLGEMKAGGVRRQDAAA
jgi:two-component system, LuxR family, sensor kinase FixL